MNKFWVAVILMFVASLLIYDRYCSICVRKNPENCDKMVFKMFIETINNTLIDHRQLIKRRNTPTYGIKITS